MKLDSPEAAIIINDGAHRGELYGDNHKELLLWMEGGKKKNSAGRRAYLINGWRTFPQVSDTKGSGACPPRVPCIFSSEFTLKLLFSSPSLLFPSFLRSPLSSSPPEWFDSGSNSKLLQDLDNSSVMEDGRKKLNTVFHYQVCTRTCCCVCETEERGGRRCKSLIL